jgi:hypothetical protein
VVAPSSLLRPPHASRVGAAVLALAALAPAALARAGPASAASPDPSPHGSLYLPDPYTPPARPKPVIVTVQATTTPVRTVQAPAATAPPVRTPARPAAHRAKPRHRAVSRAVIRAKPQPVSTPTRIPDHPVPRFVAVATEAAAPADRVSVALAAALGAFVLASALFVAGAARLEPAR